MHHCIQLLVTLPFRIALSCQVSMTTAVSREELYLLRSGHRGTEKRVFERLFERVVTACLYYTADAMLAEDAASTAFIKAFTSLDRFTWQHDGSFYGWIRKIAVREALHECRKNRYFLELEDAEGTAQTTYHQTDFRIDADIALALLNRLSPVSKAVFLLINLEGFSHAESAELLGISEGNSKQLLHRARTRLRQFMEKTQNDAHGKLGS